MKYLLFFLPALACLPSYSQSNIALGEKAPEIHITDWIANVPEDKNLSNKYIVLDFWATWCGPCIEAVPHMNELQEQFDRADLYFISLTDEPVSKVERTLKRVDFHSIVASDQTKQSQINFGDGKKGLDTYPLTVLIDKAGIVRWVSLPDEVTTAVLNDFLAGRLDAFSSIEEEMAEDAREEGPLQDNSEINLFDLINNEEVLYHFEFKKTDRLYGDMAYADKVGLKFASATLDEIFAQILDVAPGMIVMPDSMYGQRYFLLYKNAAPDEQSMQRLEEEILNVLKLEKTLVEKEIPAQEVNIKDQSLLEEAEETLFSSRSDAGDKIIFGNYSIAQMLEAVNEVSEEAFIPGEVGEGRYDFIIEAGSAEAIKKSLRSYGLGMRETQQTVEYVKLEERE